MNTNINLAQAFLKDLQKELKQSICLYTNKEKITFEYSSILITIINVTNNKEESDFLEKDILDALCRMRLLVVERYNRNLPNINRHWAYKDLELDGLKINQPSIYLTDTKKLFLITIGK